MKKQWILGAVFALCVVFAGVAKAETLSIGDVLSNLPALKQGMAYSLADNQLNYLSTAEIVKYKGFALEGGYAGAAENTGNKIVGVLSYQVANLKDLGVTVPILDLIEFNVGAYAGYGSIQFAGNTKNDNEFDYGLSLTLLKTKF